MNLMISHLLPLRSAEPSIMTRLLMSCQSLGFSPAFVAAFLKHFSKAKPANIAHFLRLGACLSKLFAAVLPLQALSPCKYSVFFTKKILKYFSRRYFLVDNKCF